MPKEILDLKEKPLSIESLIDMEKRLANSPFERVDIVNFSVTDLVLIRQSIVIAAKSVEDNA